MGWSYRKSIKLGPFRLNLSRGGVGHSWGNRLFRVTRTADGMVRPLVPVDAVVARLLDLVDIDQLLQDVIARTDLEAALTAALERIDLAAVVVDQVDLAALAEAVIEGIDLPAIVRQSSASMATETVDTVRLQGIDADRAVARLVDRLFPRRTPGER